jgi:hypothetical protein
VSRSEHPVASARDDCAETALSHRTVQESATRGIDGHFGGGVALDQLVGDRLEVLADVVRLRTDVQRGVALAEDEPGLPARCEGTAGSTSITCAPNEVNASAISTPTTPAPSTINRRAPMPLW